jgi:hypothetical protein
VRLSHRLAPLTAALAVSLPLLCVPFLVEGALHREGGARAARTDQKHAPEPFGAECRTGVAGSEVTSYCHNAYAAVDHLRLHIECDRWWDLDTDGGVVEAGPARTVRLSGRCWKEVRSAWVSHRP